MQNAIVSHNAANELRTRDTDRNSSVHCTLTHDAVGNLTDDGKDYSCVSDVFGRLKTLKNRGNSAVVAEYTCNGLNMRIDWHTSYGIPIRIDPGDYSLDGYVNGNDLDDDGDDFDNARSEADVNFDGDVNGTDLDDFSEAWDFSWFVAGRGKLSAYQNTFGYAGYTWDPVCSRYHVRSRVYARELGRWLTRDPAGYFGGMNLYDYVGSMPHRLIDPFGLYGVDDWWEDLKDGLEEMKKTWDEIFDDPSKYTEHAGNDEAIDGVQDALELCECTPLADQIVVPINIGLDLIQGDSAGAGQRVVCALIPGPGGGGGAPLKAVTPGLIPPGKFFPSLTPGQIKKKLQDEFGPPRSVRPDAETFYNPQTCRTFNVHTDPAHCPPHIDIRKRGNSPDRKYPLRGEEPPANATPQG